MCRLTIISVFISNSRYYKGFRGGATKSEGIWDLAYYKDKTVNPLYGLHQALRNQTMMKLVRIPFTTKAKPF